MVSGAGSVSGNPPIRPAGTAQCRAEMAVIVALLHDVLDDTEVTPAELEAGFGKEVAGMVKKVSRLSSLNQLLRRNRRHREERAGEVRAATCPPHPNLHPNLLCHQHRANHYVMRC